MESGAHRLSVRAVAEGRADIAAIDATAWVLATRYESRAHELTIVGQTPELPAPALLCAPEFTDKAAEIADAVALAVAELPTHVKEALVLTGFEPRDDAAYDAVSTLLAEIDYVCPH